MSDLDLSKLFKPRAIAVVGASQRDDAVGSRVLRNLRKCGYDGALYAVNPRYDEVQGTVCYPSLSEAPPVDAAFIGIPAAGGPDVIEEAGRCGIRAAVVNASGYADSDEEGRARQARLTDLARRHRVAVCGPNNSGFINVLDRVALTTFPVLPKLTPGPVAVISQSGSVAIALSQDDRNLGLGYVITAGNEAVCSVSDYLDYVVRDDRIEMVLMFLEALRDPTGFTRAAQEARRRGKPVLVVKVGRSEAGAQMAAAHTNAIAGEDALYDAFFRRLGVVRAGNLDELVETAVLFRSHPRPPAVANVVPVTVSGGEAALIADLVADRSLPMLPLSPETTERLRPAFPPFSRPRNPLDAWGLGWSLDRFRGIAAALASDPGIGAVAFAVDAPASGVGDAWIAKQMVEVCGSLEASTATRFIFVNNMAAGGLNGEVQAAADAYGLPYLNGMAAGFAAIANWTLAPRQESAAGEPASAGDAGADHGRADAVRRAGELTEPERFALMAAAGIPMVPCQQAGSVEDAVAIAQSLGYPVVLKGTSPNLPHKSELGLIRLGLGDSSAVAEAYTSIQGKLSQHAAGHPAARVVVQATAGSGVELIVGIRNEPGFGSFVVVGVGGTLVEVVRRSSVRQGPVDLETARSMLKETPAATLLDGVRGKGPFDTDAAAAAISALSRFGAEAYGTLAAVEINPLIVLERGAVGVDVLLEPVPARPKSHSPTFLEEV